MVKFVYLNDCSILNQFGRLIPDVEIEANSKAEADDIYRGYDGERAENMLRDYHLGS